VGEALAGQPAQAIALFNRFGKLLKHGPAELVVLFGAIHASRKELPSFFSGQVKHAFLSGCDHFTEMIGRYRNFAYAWGSKKTGFRLH
jgi:hypothetical protein